MLKAMLKSIHGMFHDEKYIIVYFEFKKVWSCSAGADDTDCMFSYNPTTMKSNNKKFVHIYSFQTKNHRLKN